MGSFYWKFTEEESSNRKKKFKKLFLSTPEKLSMRTVNKNTTGNF